MVTYTTQENLLRNESERGFYYLEVGWLKGRCQIKNFVRIIRFTRIDYYYDAFFLRLLHKKAVMVEYSLKIYYSQSISKLHV